MRLRYSATAPTFLAIDLVVVQHEDKPPRGGGEIVESFEAYPTGKAASPATQTTCSSPPSISRAAAIPSAADSAVPASRPIAIVVALRPQEKAVERP